MTRAEKIEQAAVAFLALVERACVEHGGDDGGGEMSPEESALRAALAASPEVKPTGERPGPWVQDYMVGGHIPGCLSAHGDPCDCSGPTAPEEAK